MKYDDRGLSDELCAFVDGAPAARAPHLTFLRDNVADLPSGAKLLDVGAGESPYRELFDRFDYASSDWAGTQYAPTVPVDIVGPAHNLPLPDGTYDLVVCTQVLEHTPEPWLVAEEFLRILKPGGRLLLTAPLTWFLHEMPHDYYRFTSYGLRFLLERAGFVDVDLRPMNSSPSTIAELMRSLGHFLGKANDGHDDERGRAASLVAKLAPLLDDVSGLDSQWLLPISFSAVARAP